MGDISKTIWRKIKRIITQDFVCIRATIFVQRSFVGLQGESGKVTIRKTQFMRRVNGKNIEGNIGMEIFYR